MTYPQGQNCISETTKGEPHLPPAACSPEDASRKVMTMIAGFTALEKSEFIRRLETEISKQSEGLQS